MKKNRNNQKAFAMAELLAISIVILLLFSILFSNYLPLVAEYENRLSYTNVTANYAAFYVRKVYKDAIESNTLYGDKTMRTHINDSLNAQKFFTLYNRNGTSNLIVTGDTQVQLLSVLDEYGVEEVIITKYKLNDVKTAYKKDSGSLYHFIKYLPNYSKSNVGGGAIEETYRIILKTANYGYATTQILADPPTPVSCFDLASIGTNKFVVTEYFSQNEECSEVVSIPVSTVKKEERSDDGNITIKEGIITAIGGKVDSSGKFVGAFEPNRPGQKPITKIYLPGNVIAIGDSAFKGNNLSSFDLDIDAPGVESIGKYAFSNNQLAKVVMTDKNKNTNNQITYGEGAFANNYKLKNIVFDFDSEEGSVLSTMSIPAKMFALENVNAANDRLRKSDYANIKLEIPFNIDTIGASAFRNIKFTSIEFENQVGDRASNLSEIHSNAFSIDDGVINKDNVYQGDDKYLRIIIPKTVTKISEGAFRNVQIGDLVFETSSGSSGGLSEIGDSAFSTVQVNITDRVLQEFCEKVSADSSECRVDENGNKVYNKILQIPVTVEKLGADAFKGQQFSSVTFSITNESGVVVTPSNLKSIGNGAFAGNNFEAVTLPSRLNGNYIGKKIFGDIEDISFGNKSGDIVVSDASMLGTSSINWCDALFGTSCQASEVVQDDIDDSEILGDDGEPIQPMDTSNYKIWTYKLGDTTKYISYFG